MRAALPCCQQFLLRSLLPLLCLAFMLGIGCARLAAPSWLLPWGTAVLLLFLLLAMPVLPGHRALAWAATPLFFCAGLLHGWQALHHPLDNKRLSRLLQERGRVTISGRVLSMVEHGDGGTTSRCTLEAHALLRHDGTAGSGSFIPVSGRVALRVRGMLSAEIQPGTLVMALGQADLPGKRRIPDTSDMVDPVDDGVFLHYAARGIDAVLWLRSADALLVLPGPEPSFRQWVRFAPERFRQRIARFLQQHLRPEIAGIYQALLIGSRQDVAPEVLEWFKAGGTMHILAISGLHLTLLAGMCAALFHSLLRRSTRVLLHGHVPILTLLLTVPVILFYAVLAGLNIPVLRALVSALLVVCAVMLHRRRLGLHVVAAAALLVLALHPLALFTVSFQLSFSAVCAIVLILPHLAWFTQKPGQGRGHRVVVFFMSILQASLAASLGTLPLLLYHFNRVSLIGPLMNVLVEPTLCFWALPLGLIALLLLPFFPQAALLSLQLGGLGVQAALVLLEKAAALPLASVWTIRPHPVEMLLFAGIMVLGLRSWPGRGLWRTVWIVFFACTLLLSMGASLWPGRRGEYLRISFIDVGQGAATLIESPGGRRILIDAGGYQHRGYDVGARVIAPFLWQRRLWRLDAALVSHPDADHYSGMPFVVRRFAPKILYTNDDPGNDTAYRQMLEQAQKQGTRVLAVTGRQELLREPDLLLECFALSPQWRDLALGDNDRSLLVRLRYGRRVFLFPADIAAKREELLLRDMPGKLLRADLLLAGHHGSIGSTGPAFLEAVSPAVVVVSAGASRQGTHPAAAHLRSWRERGIAVFVTAHSGTIEARSDGSTLCIRSAAREQCLD